MKLPAHIAKYELQEYLGGGMSEVYKARDTVLGRTVAVKLLTSQGSQNQDMRSRFLLEARVSSGISHENVITTYDYGEEEGVPYMVMEFLVGRTLKDALRSGEDIPLRRRVLIAQQLARALAHIHSLNLVHRDVKPDNVHLDGNARVKLMDFGIVKTGEVNLTQAGYALGTPHYVAPELVMGQPVTPLVDVYSFGVVFYEILTGQRAIQADTVEQIFYQILHAEISDAPLEAAGVPQTLRQIVHASTARQPEARAQSMEQVAAALEGWLEGNPTQQKALEPEAVKRKPLRISNLWMAGATALAALLAVGMAYMFQTARASTRGEVFEDALGEMILIPAGPFVYGPGNQTVDLPAFYMDRHEVDNEDFEAFCVATKRPLPDGFERGRPGYPAVNITIEEAKAFAAWAGKRLPTEKEWLKAARGSDARRYPWGDANNAKLANLADNPDDSWQHAVSTDAFRHGRSPFGIMQMIGNVREFTADRTEPSLADLRTSASLVDPPAMADEPWHAVKGGSFKYKLAETELHTNEAIPARYRAADLGFRCAKDK